MTDNDNERERVALHVNLILRDVHDMTDALRSATNTIADHNQKIVERAEYVRSVKAAEAREAIDQLKTALDELKKRVDELDQKF
jgi:phosphate uptake regulator